VLRGAISGFGEVAAQAHLAAWRARPDVTVVAIHDPIAARRHAAINRVKNVRVYDDIELMLAGEALDFVDIASPPAFHAAAARTALEAGVNVLVEKPLCLAVDEFAQLSALAACASRVLMCVHNWKHSPIYRRAHELIASGDVGVPQYVSFERLRAAPAGAGFGLGGERWRLDSKAGGGILIDHGWHVFYLAQWLLMGAAPCAISAHLELSSGSQVDDRADLRIEFSAGRVAHSHLSWRAPIRRTSATIYGDEALIEIESDRLVLTDRTGRMSDYSASELPDDSYHASWFADVAADFTRALNEGATGHIQLENLAEARAAVALVKAARESAACGGVSVTLP
jgi:predicted dehydrogenase